MNAVNHHKFFKFISLQWRDSLDVAAPGDFSSAIKLRRFQPCWPCRPVTACTLETKPIFRRLILVSDHLFEIMRSTRHLPGIAGDASGQSSNTQCAS